LTANTDLVFKPPSAVERIAQQLRAMALKMPEGDYVGSEQRLSQQFMVSGPTLRQAIRLLEHEGLIKVRRGVHGGYYVGRANIDTLTRAAATYLHGHMKSYDEVMFCKDFLVPIMIDDILKSDRLGEMSEYISPFHDDTMEAFIARQNGFLKVLMELIDNVVLQFFSVILYQTIGSLRVGRATGLTEAHRAIERLRADLAQALVNNDRDRAIAEFAHLSRMVGGAIKESLEAGSDRGNGHERGIPGAILP
jgi:DNA-binding FadR family transcriptional regulator